MDYRNLIRHFSSYAISTIFIVFLLFISTSFLLHSNVFAANKIVVNNWVTKYSMSIGDTYQVIPDVEPSDAVITYKVSAKKIASIDSNGLITALKKGKCKVTATFSYGKWKKIKKTISITVANGGVPSNTEGIVSFSVPGQIGSSVIDYKNKTIAFTVPDSQVITNLAPTITLSNGYSISPASGIERNFTVPVIYLLKSPDGIAEAWTALCTKDDSALIATLSGDYAKITEKDIVVGGKEVVITLPEGKWLLADGNGLKYKNATAALLIDAITTSGTADQQKQCRLFKSYLKACTAKGVNEALYRTNDTMLTIILPKMPQYQILSSQSLYFTVPKKMIQNGKNDIFVSPPLRVIKKQFGILSGSISNNGFVCEYGDWLIVSADGKIIKASTDGTRHIRLASVDARYINVVDDMLYFQNLDDNGCIYTLSVEGGTPVKLNNDRSEYINVVDDYIYFRNVNNGGKACRICIDGSGYEILSTENVKNLNITEDKMYFINASDKSIYSKSLNDAVSIPAARLNYNRSEYLNVDGENLYYCNLDDFSSIYMMRDSAEEESAINRYYRSLASIKICDANASNLFIANHQLYFINGTDNYFIYSIFPGEAVIPTLRGNISSQNISIFGNYVVANPLGSQSVQLLNQDNDSIIPVVSSEYGNSFSNMNSGGNFAGDDSWVYFRNPADYNSLYKMSLSGNTIMKINSTPTRNINLLGANLYYYDENRKAIIKNIAGAELELRQGVSDHIMLIDDMVYFMDKDNISNGGILYRMDVDGNYMERLNDEKILEYVIDDEYIYYSGLDGRLYKKKTGNTAEEVSATQNSYLGTDEHIIYYINQTDGNAIYKLVNGTEKVRISNDQAKYLNVANGWIYFVNIDDNGYIYRMRVTGSERVRLNQIDSSELFVIENRIYFYNNDKKALFRMNVDGSDIQPLNRDSLIPILIVSMPDITIEKGGTKTSIDAKQYFSGIITQWSVTKSVSSNAPVEAVAISGDGIISITPSAINIGTEEISVSAANTYGKCTTTFAAIITPPAIKPVLQSMKLYKQPEIGYRTTTGSIDLSVQPVVMLLDTNNNQLLIDNDSLVNVSVVSAITTAALLMEGTTTVKAVSGLASFNDLKFKSAADARNISLRFTTSNGGIYINSYPFDFSAKTINSIDITRQPVIPVRTTTGALDLTVTPVIALKDSDGAVIVVDSSSVLEAEINSSSQPSSISLAGNTTAQAINGIVTFDGLKLVGTKDVNNIEVGFHLIQNTSISTSAIAFDYTAYPPDSLDVITQPDAGGRVTDGAINICTMPAIEIKDSFGNRLVTDSDSIIQAALTTSVAGVILSGNTTAAAINGIATFSGLKLEAPSDQASVQLVFTIVGKAINVTSAAFTYAIPPIEGISIITQPVAGTFVSGSSIALITQPAIKLMDIYGRAIETDDSSSIDAGIVSAITTSALTLGGTMNRTAVAGAVTFNDLTLNANTTAGSIVLRFSLSSDPLIYKDSILFDYD